MRTPPPVLALAAALVQRALTRDAPSPTVSRTVVSGATAMAALALAGAAAERFHRVGTTVDPHDPTRATVLVTTGANSASRNPMYVGLIVLLVAHAIRRSSWVALIPVAAFTLAIDRLQIAEEETALRSSFGAEYDAYCERVPRWLGPRSLASLRQAG